jgi:hypothetical protein
MKIRLAKASKNPFVLDRLILWLEQHGQHIKITFQESRKDGRGSLGT